MNDIRQPPSVQEFNPAVVRSVQSPIVPRYEKLEVQTPPVHLQMDYYDVVAAIPNTVGNTNQLRTRGPSLLVIDGYKNTQATPHDLGGIELWCATENGPGEELGKVVHCGPYFFLPFAGKYYIRGYLLETPILGPTPPVGAHFPCTLYEGIDPALAIAMMQTGRVSHVQTRSTTIGAATVTPLLPPVAAGYHGAPAILVDPFSMSAHCRAVTISNSGATNPVTVAVNNKSINAFGAHLLTTGQSTRFEVGGIFTIYAFSTVGTTVSATWEYI